MRKITSRLGEEKRRKRNQLILGIFLIFVMFGSVISFVIPFGFGIHRGGINGGTVQGDQGVQNRNTITYNGFEFTEQSGFWILNLDGDSFIFRHNPREILDLNFTVNSLSSYIGKPLYIYSESISSGSEIRVNLLQFVETLEFLDSEPKKCVDNFITVKEADINKIEQKDNCVFIEGKKEDLTKLTDEFLFKILGVI